MAIRNPAFRPTSSPRFLQPDGLHWKSRIRPRIAPPARGVGAREEKECPVGGEFARQNVNIPLFGGHLVHVFAVWLDYCSDNKWKTVFAPKHAQQWPTKKADHPKGRMGTGGGRSQN